ncbi:MAG TPA: hypothetical protein VFE45_19315 [Coriobacteriia bacterium]|nr:hypothetical protein [Coriobacteriia bacterium]
MPILEMVAGGIAGFALGWIACFKLGERARGKAPWHYWVANVAVIVLGMALIGVGLTYGLEWPWVGVMGFVTSGLTGLKYGRAKIVGRGSLAQPEPEERDVPKIWNE